MNKMEKEILYGVAGLIAGASASGIYYKAKLSKFRNDSLAIFQQIGEYFYDGMNSKTEALRLRDKIRSLKDTVEVQDKKAETVGMNVICNNLEREITTDKYFPKNQTSM